MKKVDALEKEQKKALNIVTDKVTKAEANFKGQKRNKRKRRSEVELLLDDADD